MTSALLRRYVAPAAAAAAPLLVAGLLGGLAQTPEAGDGPMVRAVPVNGPLGADESTEDPLADDLTGAHPVTFPSATAEVVTAEARETAPAPDFSDRALPGRVLTAYRAAARSLGRSDSACHLPWTLLAGIGKVESGHAYGGAVDRTGLTLTPILGPVLDGGPGVAAIPDTDGGRWDTDKTWDRAVGPMQFIPSSWVVHGQDGNSDGDSDPNNVDDAALAAAGYLCTGDRDVRVERDRRAAVFSYNHSWDYVDLVLAWADAYADGVEVFTGTLAALPAGDEAERPGRRPGDGTAAPSPVATGDPSAEALPLPGPVAGAGGSADGPTAGAGGSGTDGGSTAGTGSPTGTGSPAPDPTDSPTSGGSTRATPTPSDSPTPTPASTTAPPPEPTPEPTPTDCPTPTDSPSPDPSGSTSPEPTPTPSPTQVDATATPTPTPTPSETCGSTASGT